LNGSLKEAVRAVRILPSRLRLAPGRLPVVNFNTANLNLKPEGATVPEETPQTGLSDSAASGLAYITIIPAIIFLIVPPYNQKPLIRFHSWQSIFFCIAWIVISIALTILHFMPFLGWFVWPLRLLVDLGLFILWVIVLIKAFNGERFKIPVIGDFAEKQANG
jgi:uncharacterized membrane protein